MAELLKCSLCGELFDNPTKAKLHTNNHRGRCRASGAVLLSVTISVRTSDRIAGGREQRITDPGNSENFVPQAVDEDQNHDNDFSHNDVHHLRYPRGLPDADTDVMEGSIFDAICGQQF